MAGRAGSPPRASPTCAGWGGAGKLHCNLLFCQQVAASHQKPASPAGAFNAAGPCRVHTGPAGGFPQCSLVAHPCALPTPAYSPSELVDASGSSSLAPSPTPKAQAQPTRREPLTLV